MLDLKEMTVEELKELRNKINEELLERNSEKVAYQHDCYTESKYHMNKFKHWAKIVTDVDLSKNTAYGFIGKFLDVNSTHLLPKGSIVVECCGVCFTGYRITGDYEKEKIFSRGKGNTVECLRDTEKALKGE